MIVELYTVILSFRSGAQPATILHIRHRNRRSSSTVERKVLAFSAIRCRAQICNCLRRNIAWKCFLNLYLINTVTVTTNYVQNIYNKAFFLTDLITIAASKWRRNGLTIYQRKDCFTTPLSDSVSTISSKDDIQTLEGFLFSFALLFLHSSVRRLLIVQHRARLPIPSNERK